MPRVLGEGGGGGFIEEMRFPIKTKTRPSGIDIDNHTLAGPD
jgi:hypothetical protein